MHNRNPAKFILPVGDLRNRFMAVMAQQGEDFNRESALVAISLVTLAEEIQQSFSIHFARYGLTQARFVILLTLFTGKKKAHSPIELARTINVKPPTVTALLDGLAKDRLIERKRDVLDRRKILITLTAKGKKKIREILPDHFGRISSSFKNMAVPEWKSQLVALFLGETNLSLQKLCSEEKRNG